MICQQQSEESEQGPVPIYIASKQFRLRAGKEQGISRGWRVLGWRKSKNAQMAGDSQGVEGCGGRDER